jgi:hypothetical protein
VSAESPWDHRPAAFTPQPTEFAASVTDARTTNNSGHARQPRTPGRTPQRAPNGHANGWRSEHAHPERAQLTFVSSASVQLTSSTDDCQQLTTHPEPNRPVSLW